MRNYKEHLLQYNSSIREALIRLDSLGMDAILFIIDKDDKLIGSLTDGDIRRGLIKGFVITDSLKEIIQSNPRYIVKDENYINKIIEYRENNFRIIPIVDKDNIVKNVINFREIRSYLPIDAVVMAGGRGERLKPLTDKIPKPLLLVGDKPIMKHNLDRLVMYGIDDFWVTVRYLGEQIENYFGNGETQNVNIKYVKEDIALGTIGAVSLIDDFMHEHILVTNSDVLTNIDYEHFFIEFLKSKADFAVVTIPYQISVPYAVLETENGSIKSFKEKPTYTYYSNGGIYLMKKDILDFIPKGEYFNATDLMEVLISKEYNIMSYPLSGYWLDVGKHEDFEKAQYDITRIKF